MHGAYPVPQWPSPPVPVLALPYEQEATFAIGPEQGAMGRQAQPATNPSGITGALSNNLLTTHQLDVDWCREFVCTWDRQHCPLRRLYSKRAFCWLVNGSMRYWNRYH